MLHIRKRKQQQQQNIYIYIYIYIYETTAEVTKQKKKIDSHQMDQRYHHMWKGLGLGLFFTMSAAL